MSSFSPRITFFRRASLSFLCLVGVAAQSPAEPAIPEGMPVLNIVHADGTKTLDFKEVADKPAPLEDKDGVTTSRVFKDAAHNLTFRLFRKTYRDWPVAEEWTELENNGQTPVVIERIESSAPVFKPRSFLKQYSGGWSNELNPVEGEVVKPVSTGSSLGTRACMMIPPFFLISPDGPIRETEGTVFAGSLVWNSNFAFNFVPSSEGVTAHCGINPLRSRYTLDPGKTFTAPKMLWASGSAGAGELARMMHRFVREKYLRDGNTPRPVLLNNWETTGFNFDENRLLGLFDGAKEGNFDLFLLDDGWFGVKHPRINSKSGLGDWTPNPKRLPHGIQYLCDEARKRGLRFGIWIEPEMINPDSELYENHPDWVLQFPGQPLKLTRNQAVLDLTRPETREAVFKSVDDLLTQNPGISYVKWDCNSQMNQPGSPWLPQDRQENLYVDYANALDDIMTRLEQRHPKVTMMLCSAGGGRVDLRSMRHFHEFWPSDTTDPVRRVPMQWEYLQFYPAMAISGHVTKMGHRPLKFAVDVASSVRLGVDLDRGKLSPEDRGFLTHSVATYKKEILPLVQFGALYRLESPYDTPRTALSYVSKDKSSAVLFVYQMKDAPAAPVRMQGLDPGEKYFVHEMNLPEGAASSLPENGKVFSGEALMNAGIVPPCSHALESAVILFEKAARP